MRESSPSGQRWLLAAATGSFAVAALHLAMIPIGAPAYAYFGAADLALLAAQSSLVPALLTLLLVLFFLLFGTYALAGAGRVRCLPLLRIALLGIGTLYTLRGLLGLLFPREVYALAGGVAPFPPRYTLFSAISLALGLVYLVGTARAWGGIRAPPARR